ncbi:hypothetical protein PQX77_018501 [Marasmius sp. AFHP31]|nr:hypothetical protein PQX77_018501 [Marasmius sp. AFHP31]
MSYVKLRTTWGFRESRGDLENAQRVIQDVLEDEHEYWKVIKTEGDDAQKWLDLLQMVAEQPAITAQLQSSILEMILRLSKRSRLYPTSLVIKTVKKPGGRVEDGVFGDVWAGKIGGVPACLRMVRIHSGSDAEKLDYMREAILWKQLRHPNVLSFLGMYYDLNGDPETLYLVSPWMDKGNLYYYIKETPREDLDHLSLAYDVAAGLSYLHSKEIVHGDLQCANILMKEDGSACIGHFGLSRIAERYTTRSSASTSRGMVTYMTSMSSDIYDYGCVCYRIFTGNSPFHNLPYSKQHPDRPVEVLEITDSMWEIMVACWQHDPYIRPSSTDILARIGEMDCLQDAQFMVQGILTDEHKYRKILEAKGDDAQECLDLLQVLVERSNITAELQSSTLKLMLRLSKRSGLCPKCLVVRNVKKPGGHPLMGGSFGDVYKEEMGGQVFCLKVARIFEDFGESGVKNLIKGYMREAILWKQLRHPNLLPFIGMYYLDEGRNQLCLISPWMDRGDLTRYLKNTLRENVDHLSLAYDIAAGLSYLHSKKIVHGDLKGVNVLINADETACIGDFGLARVAEVHMPGLFTSTTGVKGTTRWLSPELLDPRLAPCQTSMRSDIYAYACVCYEIFTGTYPFHDLRDGAVILAVITHKKHPDRPKEARELSDSMWEIMLSCWQHNQQLRPRAVDLLARVGALENPSTGTAIQSRQARDCDALDYRPMWLEAYYPPIDTGLFDRLLEAEWRASLVSDPEALPERDKNERISPSTPGFQATDTRFNDEEAAGNSSPLSPSGHDACPEGLCRGHHGAIVSYIDESEPTWMDGSADSARISCYPDIGENYEGDAHGDASDDYGSEDEGYSEASGSDSSKEGAYSVSDGSEDGVNSDRERSEDEAYSDSYGSEDGAYSGGDRSEDGTHTDGDGSEDDAAERGPQGYQCEDRILREHGGLGHSQRGSRYGSRLREISPLQYPDQQPTIHPQLHPQPPDSSVQRRPSNSYSSDDRRLPLDGQYHQHPSYPYHTGAVYGRDHQYSQQPLLSHKYQLNPLPPWQPRHPRSPHRDYVHTTSSYSDYTHA